MGLFIVLEGVEGSGKTTQARLLGERLARAGIDHLVTREPGGTATGEEIRRLLLHGGEVPARAELLLMLAARAVFVEEVVRPALARGAVVVADRYELSTLAYQGYGRGLPLDEVRRMNAFATGGLTADLTLVLDVPPEVGAARRAREGGTPTGSSRRVRSSMRGWPGHTACLLRRSRGSCGSTGRGAPRRCTPRSWICCGRGSQKH